MITRITSASSSSEEASPRPRRRQLKRKTSTTSTPQKGENGHSARSKKSPAEVKTSLVDDSGHDTPSKNLRSSKTSNKTIKNEQARRDSQSQTPLIEKLKEKAIEIKLQTWHEIEHWQRDNEFLLSGYRRVSNSYRSSFHSLTYIHNQTANIYSHLLGAVVFLFAFLFIYFILVPRYKTADMYDVGIFASFFTGALICFGISATFHTLGNHSHKVYHTWLLMDLYGIMCLICGTVYSGTYYGFYCEPSIWMGYSVQITILTILCASICTIPRFRAPKWRFVRAVFFGFILLSGAVPMTHAARVFGKEQLAQQMGFWWLVSEACLYAIGAVIYATRFPECLKPGAFDIWGNSHQVFHVFAVLGAFVHLIGIIIAFDFNHNPATRRC